jgi:hypothetical protein
MGVRVYSYVTLSHNGNSRLSCLTFLGHLSCMRQEILSELNHLFASLGTPLVYFYIIFIPKDM